MTWVPKSWTEPKNRSEPRWGFPGIGSCHLYQLSNSPNIAHFSSLTRVSYSVGSALNRFCRGSVVPNDAQKPLYCVSRIYSPLFGCVRFPCTVTSEYGTNILRFLTVLQCNVYWGFSTPVGKAMKNQVFHVSPNTVFQDKFCTLSRGSRKLYARSHEDDRVLP